MKKLFTAFFMLLGASTNSYADDAPVAFQFNLPMWTYLSAKEGSSKATQSSTTPGGAELVLTVSEWHLHVLPTSTDVPFQVGYDVIPNLEAGVALKANHTKRESENQKVISQNLGLYVSYTVPFDSHALELGLTYLRDYDFADKLDLNSGNALQVESKASEYIFVLNYVIPMRANLFLVPSLFLGEVHTSEKLIETQTQNLISETTSKKQVWALTPLSIRLNF